MGHNAAAVFGVTREDAEMARHVKPGWRNRCAESDQQVVGLQRESVGSVFLDIFEREGLSENALGRAVGLENGRYVAWKCTRARLLVMRTPMGTPPVRFA